MPVIIIPRAQVSGGSAGEGGQSFSNSGTLSLLSSDAQGNLLFGGKTVGEKALEVAYNLILSEQNIAACSIMLPDDCDSSRSITLALQGMATLQGIDWIIEEHDSPTLDAIVWNGLGLQEVAQLGDSVLITYYKKI